jgi:hypothetical protein
MKKLLLFIVLLCSISLSFSQEKQLSEEEKAKRERNIQAGNPFKEFGYTPKIATLSKGKYLEFHDLDSIVKIGSFTFHVKEKAINGYSQEEIKYSEATLRPEIVSRWFSPDPLSEEFPSWSPYNFTMNNPIRFIDPDGRAPMDIILKGANNSSVTIVTDLIDVSVDASSFVGDLGGNYSFQGDDILVAGLDIVGIVDPTGVADIASASIEAKNGNWGGAILSGLGVIPYVGDIGKVGKIGKHVKTIENAISSVKKIGPAGDAGASVTKQLPSNWTMKMSDNKQGTKFLDPKNPSGNNVRAQRGNPNSPNPAQQQPYVKQMQNGKQVDVNGKQVPSNSAESHIPTKDFKYKKD